MRRRRSLQLLGAAFAALTVAGTGCGEAAEPMPRWAHRFLPYEEQWRPESEVPREPQESPAMVIWEVSRFAPGTPPTPEQREAADDLVARCYEAALRHRWYDFDQGLADGYRLMFQDTRHYENREYMLDDHILDPDRPEFLMYYGTPQGKELAGFMFYADTPTGAGPQIGGNLTLWHYHVWSAPICLLSGLVSLAWAEDGSCKEGIPSHRSPEMIHVWLLDLPKGPFQTSMWLDASLLQELIAKRDRERPAVAALRGAGG